MGVPPPLSPPAGPAPIQWTTTSLLAPGDSATGFIFDSTMTPLQFLGMFPGPGLGMGDPISTAFIYIAAPLADPGAQITATTAMVIGTPEPSTLWLSAIAMTPLWRLPPGFTASELYIRLAFCSISRRERRMGRWGGRIPLRISADFSRCHVRISISSA